MPAAFTASASALHRHLKPGAFEARPLPLSDIHPIDAVADGRLSLLPPNTVPGTNQRLCYITPFRAAIE